MSFSSCLEQAIKEFAGITVGSKIKIIKESD